MAPAYVSPVSVYGGDSLYLEYRFRTDIAPAGDPVDLSDWTFTAQWRHERSADTAIDFTVDQSNKAGGIIILTMTGDQTESMSSANGFFDLNGVNGTQVRTFLQGKTVWVQDVTRD
jgi:hypothetical protein